MADRVTCCPHCSTSFRITEAQLQTARGAVRCGSCLQIFRAPDHLLPLPETAATAPATPAAGYADAARGAAEDDGEPATATGEHDEFEPEYDDEPSLTGEFPDTDDLPNTDSLTDTDNLSDSDDSPYTDAFPGTDDNSEEAKTAALRPVRYDDALFDDALFDDSLIGDDEEDDGDYDLDLDEDALISDDMGLDLSPRSFSLGELSEDFLDSDSSKTVKSSLFDRELKVRESESDHADESWAEELLQEIETESAAEEPPPASDILKSFGDRQVFGEQQGLGEFTTVPSTGPFASDDKLSADDDTHGDGGYHHLSTGSFDKLDDIPLDDEGIDAVLGERFSAHKEPLFSVTGERDSAVAGNDAEDPHPARSDEQTPAPQPLAAAAAPLPPSAPAREHDLLLQGISPAPVEMDWHIEVSPWPRRLLWGGLSLLACVVLVAQFAWFKFDQYSRIEPWRGVYGSLCPLLGCTLPPLADPARVKAYNLVVRTSPQADNALVIDSILLNTAGFAQPFPDFALSFSNLQGKQLAYRRFTPQEYLGGEMAGATLMPSGQPVHISLEIVDPGADAVNYTATIPRD